MLDTKILYNGAYKSRVLQMEINQKKLVTPTYFPSISSVATRLPLEPLIQSIVRSGYPRLLVSAYDLAHLPKENYNRISKTLAKFSKENNFLLIDSGSFESYWFHDKKWSFKKYGTIINKTKSDFFTLFAKLGLNILTKSLHWLLLLQTKLSNKYVERTHASRICFDKL